MKRFSLLLALLVAVPAVGQNPYSDYIAKYADLAVAEMQRTGVPASITLAQGLVESAAGESPLALYANNHFGIKCNGAWAGKKYYKDDDEVQECFRVYESAEASYRAHSDYLRERERYRGLFELDPADYKAWARGLRQAGYATDPRYADKLIRLIEEYDLDRYDRPAEEDTAEVQPAPALTLRESADTLFRDGPAALIACDVKAPTPAFENVVEANVLLSGIGFENVGCSIAHAIGNAITAIPEGERAMHGERVAFGTLCLLIAEDYPDDEIGRVLDLCVACGLPITFEALGLDPSQEDLEKIAEAALAAESWSASPADIHDVAGVVSLMRAANALGMSALG